MRRSAKKKVPVFADSPGGHKSKELEKPAKIPLEVLPPYSPELNRAKHRRDGIREQKDFNHHRFASRDVVENHLLEEVRKSLKEEKDYLNAPAPSSG